MGAQVDILNTSGEPVGSAELPDQLFGVEISEYALYRAVVTYEANQRQGNASTRTRSEIRRTSKKHHRQKGTGSARRGSLRSPLVRGGGVAFGPHPRSYYSKLPKRLKRLAFCSALSRKASLTQVKIVEDFEFAEPSTKTLAGIIEACGLRHSKVLVVTPRSTPCLYKSCRNLPSVDMVPVETLGAYCVVAAEVLLFTQLALQQLAQIHPMLGAGVLQDLAEGRCER